MEGLRGYWEVPVGTRGPGLEFWGIWTRLWSGGFPLEASRAKVPGSLYVSLAKLMVAFGVQGLPSLRHVLVGTSPGSEARCAGRGPLGCCLHFLLSAWVNPHLWEMQAQVSGICFTGPGLQGAACKPGPAWYPCL